ncbi:B12-binding domain/radical SAM domain-containing protein [Stigmatella sp. ncwal1]|uniref:B12-binding domain/radical SAM domain-containing protein n=1 Tax=Stigmatella ashevillensis TaxID=2995309 RepID=A0ABT5DAL4_9BACT|nr:B12-binding domain/radical SAM domain-containing protein [Stigmatella ashevillena]MDC0710707.1 B12-binding domain/radical SAM domain-containing protein [Stigmatella ashevillena]
MTLRAVAVSAPDWIEGSKDSRALNSRDPASLFNACRYAALKTFDPSSSWSSSNWVGTRVERRSKVLLMYSLDDMPAFAGLLQREQPNLLLIGAMTLCLPGAVACAEVAKEILGDRVLVVLGGRHASESMYLERHHARTPDNVRHHPSSPLHLMASGRIPRVFDLVVAGDGEHLIAALGEAVAQAEQESGVSLPRAVLERLDPRTPGDWIAGTLEGETSRVLLSARSPIHYASLPSPVRMFGAAAAFSVFGGRITAHAFSDTGRGCVYDCAFCSERSSVTGGLQDPMNAAARLYRQLDEAVSVISEDHPARGASAFVEDSVILGGSPRLVDQLAERMEADPLDIAFGAQLTIDQILTRRAQLTRMARLGLRYVFVGIETLVPETIGGMSKDLGHKRASWLSRIHQAMELLRDQGIHCGCAILFGLGEPQERRLELLEVLRAMRGQYGMPEPISANWAVQHPLCGQDGGAGYDYTEWGTPPGPFLECFHRFGEASVRYPLPQVGAPLLHEVKEVTSLLDTLAMPPPSRASRLVEERL